MFRLVNSARMRRVRPPPALMHTMFDGKITTALHAEELILSTPYKTASDCTTAMTLLAKVSSKNPDAIDLVVKKSEQIHFPPAHLASFCSAVARGNLLKRMPAFVQTNLETSDLKNFSEKNLASIIASFKALGNVNEELGTCIARELARRNLDCFTASDLAVLLNSLAVVGVDGEAGRNVAQAIANELLSRPDWSPSALPNLELSMLTKYFGVLTWTPSREYVNTTLFQRLAKECAQRDYAQESVLFEILLLSNFARVDQACPELCRIIMRDLLARREEELGNRHFALVLRCLTRTLGEDAGDEESQETARDLEALCERFSRELLKRDLSTMRASDFAEILSCFQFWALRDVPLMTKFARELQARGLQALTGRELETLVLCMEWFDFADAEFFQFVAKQLSDARSARAMTSTYTVRNLGLLTNCLLDSGKLSAASEQALLASMAQLLLGRNLAWRELSPEELVLLLNMFAKQAPTMTSAVAVLNQIAGAILARAKLDDELLSFSNQDLSQILGAFAKYRNRYMNIELGNALADACALRNVNEFTLRDLSLALEGLEALRFDNPGLAMKMLTHMTNRVEMHQKEREG